MLEDGTPKRRLTFGVALRWPLFMVALFGILWYMPARLEGVLAGITVSLLSTIFAALRLPTNDTDHG